MRFPRGFFDETTIGRYRLLFGNLRTALRSKLKPTIDAARVTPLEFLTNVALRHEFPTTRIARPPGLRTRAISDISLYRSSAYRSTIDDSRVDSAPGRHIARSIEP